MDSISARQLSSSALGTLAALAAAPGPPQACRVYVEETDAPYEFVPADATAANGWTSIAPTGGTAGRWLLRSSRISIAAIGGGADDTARLQAAVTATAGVCRLELRAGTFRVAQPITVPDYAKIKGAGRGVTTVVSTIVPTGGPGDFLQSVFIALLAPVGGGVNTTLTAQANPLATQISMLAAPIAGQRLLLRSTLNANVQQNVGVGAVAGVGPFVVTLTTDTPVEFTFPIGSAAIAATFPTGIEIEALTITGTGDRAVEISGATNCKITDIEVSKASGSFTAIALSFDNSSSNSQFIRPTVDGGGLSSGGVAAESSVHCTIDTPTITNCGSNATMAGILVLGSAGTTIIAPRLYKNSIGILVKQTGPGDIDAATDVTIVGGFIEVSTFAAVWVTNASKRISVLGTTMDGGAGDGVITQGGADGYPAGLRFKDTTIKSFAGFTCNLQGGTQILFDGLSISGNNAILNTLSIVTEVEFRAVRGTHTSAAAVAIACAAAPPAGGAGSRMLFEDWDVTFTPGVQADFFGLTPVVNNNLEIIRRNIVIRCDANAVFSQTYAGGTGVLIIRDQNVRITGGKFGIYFNAAVCTYIDNGGVDFSTATTPITFDATTIRNYGTVQLTANVVKNVAYAPIVTNNRVTLNRVAVAGGTGLTPLCVITQGTGFGLTSAIADNDTYDWKVSA